jgi:dethiobiotin synthetase
MVTAEAARRSRRSRAEVNDVRRIIVLGTGTGVGKTHVSVALGRAFAASDPRLRIGLLKPVETGRQPHTDGDAQHLERENRGVSAPVPHPLYGFEPPISPHLAARRAGRPIDVREVALWVEAWERAQAARSTDVLVIESAGGVFTPLGDNATNFDLARALEPAIWLLVAPDALGVLHELTATLRALGAAGRAPDHVVLSAARGSDESTGTNADELRRLGIADPVLELGPNAGDATVLVERLSRVP